MKIKFTLYAYRWAILAVFMFMREPEMMNDMLVHPMGRTMLVAALVLEIIGIFVFRKIIKIHI